MKSLLPLTREAKNSLFFAPIVLVEMEYRTSTGALRTLYMANKQYVDSNGRTYINILARREGVSDISYSIGNFGGVASVSEAVITLVNTTSDPNVALSDLLLNYTLSNQNVRIMYVLQPSTEKIGIFSGKIQNLSTALSTIRITINSNQLTDFVDVPSKLFEFAEYPNVPIQSLGNPIPIAFGTLNDLDNGFLTPLREYDFLIDAYTSGERMKSYGDVYVWPDGATSFLNIPDTVYLSVDNGRLIERFRPPRSSSGTVRAGRVGMNFSGYDGWVLGQMYFVDRDNLDIAGVLPRFTERVTGMRLEASIGIYADYYDDDIEDYIEQGTRGTFDLSFPFFNETISYVYERDTDPDDMHEDLELFHGGILPGSDTLELRGRVGDDAPWEESLTATSTFDTGVFSSAFVQVRLDFTTDYGLSTSDDTYFRLSGELFVSYRTRDFGVGTFYQIVEGYEDLPTNYRDGGVVKSVGDILTHPIDWLHAVLRDKDHGMNFRTASVDRSDIDTHRDRLPDYKLDFVMDEIYDFDKISDFLQVVGVRMLFGSDDQWKIQSFNAESPVTNVFTHGWNIHEGSLTIKSSPFNELYNHFFIRYGWHAAEERYTKALIRSPFVKGEGMGRLADDGTFTTGTRVFTTPPLVGDRMFYQGRYYIVSAITTGNTQSFTVRRELFSSGSATGIVPSTVDRQFYLGSNFDYQCYLSHQKYGVVQSFRGGQAQALELREVIDDRTAILIAHALVNYYSDIEDVVDFKTGLNGIDLDAGDEIGVVHQLLSQEKYSVTVGTLDSDINNSTGTIDVVSDNDETLGFGNLLLIEHPVHAYFEVISVFSVRITTQGADGFRGFKLTNTDRGQVNTFEREFPEGAQVKFLNGKFFIRDSALQHSTGILSVSARSVTDKGAYDDETPGGAMSPSDVLLIGNEPVTIDGEHVTINQ